MANADLYLISVTKQGGGELEFKAVMNNGEAETIRGQLRKQYEAGAVRDYGVFQLGTDEYVSFNAAMAKLAPK